MDNTQPTTQYIGFRVPEDMAERIKELADKERRTLSQMARILLEDSLSQRESKAQKGRASCNR